MTDALTVALLGLLVVVAVLTALLRDLVAATVTFAAYSLGMAILWLVLRAPDVGLTEAAVGAGVTAALFLAVVARTTADAEATIVAGVRPASLAAAGAVVVALGATIPALPAVGDPGAPAFQRVAPYYLENARAELGVANAVTAVLAGYRAFDTFGEVVVVFAAAVATLVVLRTGGGR